MASRDKHRRRVVTAWIQNLSSCSFAASFAKNAHQPDSRIVIATYEWPVPPEVLGDMDALLDDLGEHDRAALLSFPSIEAEKDVIGLLKTLAETTGRWTVKSLGDADPQLLQVTWRTRDGEQSNVMGLAPFLSMPETRRMPYVGLALWPGKKAKHTKGVPGVSFRDMPSRLDKAMHAQMITETRKNVDDAFGTTERSSELFAFRLPRRVTAL